MSLAIIPIDPAYMLLIGVIFGIAAVRNRKRALLAGFVSTTLFGVLIPGYCYLKEPAWMWGYGIDPATVHPWLVVWVFILYYICFYAGFAMTPKRFGGLLFLGVGALNLALIGLVWPVYSKVGTYQQFHNGTAANLPDSSLSMVLNIGGGVSLVGIVILFLWARRKGPGRPLGSTSSGSPQRDKVAAR